MDSPLSATATRKEEGSATPRQTLTIVDNRTGKSYEIPITHDTIRAADLRQIKVFFFKQKSAYEVGLGIPAEPLFRSAFSRSGWLWPVDAKGEPLKATSYMAVGFYVAKYVNKKSDMDLAAKGLGAKEWNNSLKTKLSLLPKKLFRIRMS